MEVMLSLDRYAIMKYVSQQTKEFRFVEMYCLLKKSEPERWEAEDVKTALEWLADMGLVRKKLLKAEAGQTWLYYKSCFDYDFLLSRTRQEGGGHCADSVVYVCEGAMEKLRYTCAGIKEKLNRAAGYLSYKSPFIIAEFEFAVPMTQKEKTRLKKKIDELDE